ncbi:MAG TPA: YbaN family protein [Anaeromyxobacter sp.]|nr:YbaN family protein [Anaeromyxobacter sp.]
MGGTENGARDGVVAAHRRWLMLALGWIFFGLGLLGTVLPLLPTTPFMLLALWAFSTGSRRFHAWLYHHRVFGPPLRRWDRDRVIPRWAKAVAVASMTASFLWAWLGTDAPWYGLAAMGVVMAAGVAYIARFPSRPRRRGLGTDAPSCDDA